MENLSLSCALMQAISFMKSWSIPVLFILKNSNLSFTSSQVFYPIKPSQIPPKLIPTTLISPKYFVYVSAILLYTTLFFCFLCWTLSYLKARIMKFFLDSQWESWLWQKNTRLFSKWFIHHSSILVLLK